MPGLLLYSRSTSACIQTHYNLYFLLVQYERSIQAPKAFLNLRLLYSEGSATTTSIPFPTTSPPGNGTFQCTYEGDVINYFNQTSAGPLGRFEGVFEVCVGGFYGSVCDIGWDEAAAQAICRNQFGSSYGTLCISLLCTHDDCRWRRLCMWQCLATYIVKYRLNTGIKVCMRAFVSYDRIITEGKRSHGH